MPTAGPPAPKGAKTVGTYYAIVNVDTRETVDMHVCCNIKAGAFATASPQLCFLQLLIGGPQDRYAREPPAQLLTQYLWGFNDDKTAEQPQAEAEGLADIISRWNSMKVDEETAARILAWAKQVCLGFPGIETAPGAALRLDGYGTLIAELAGNSERYSVALIARSIAMHGDTQAARQWRAELALLESAAAPARQE
jgi:hypothetical protein